MHPMTELRAAVRPFVARSLRGPRARRSLALSAVLAAVVVALGLWLARGDGELERETRRGLRLEKSSHELMVQEFVFVAHNEWALRDAKSELRLLVESDHVDFDRHGGALHQMAAAGHDTLRAALAVHPVAIPIEHAELAGRARIVLDRHAHWSSDRRVGRSAGFDWNDEAYVGRLRTIVEHDLVPEIVEYGSPLGTRESIGIVGLLAGLLLTVLATVVAPVLVGIAVAQETHENTLQPLTGTSLSPRQLALGLIVGPAAPVAIVALPQLALVLFASVLVARPLPALAFVALLVPCVFALAMLAQVVGLHAGKRRGAGIIGITLLALAGTWALVGFALGIDQWFTRSKAGVMALVPSGGLVHFLREAFVGGLTLPAHLEVVDGVWFGTRLVVSAITCVVLGVLALRATERRILGRFATPLSRTEAFVGVAVLSTLTLLAVPEGATQAWLGTLAMLVMPMQIFVMGRVPVGDAPAGTARVRTGALLGEFAAFVAIHAVFATAIVGVGWLDDLRPVSTLQLGWGLAVAALVSIRVVAAPAKLPVLVWAGFAYVLAIITFVTGAINLASARQPYGHRTELLFALWEASPVLGLVQAAFTLAIPVLFVRALRQPTRADAAAKDLA
jgi:hypothetical protein